MEHTDQVSDKVSKYFSPTCAIFRDELLTLQACNRVVQDSKRHRASAEFYFQLNGVNFELITIGLMRLIQESDERHMVGSIQTMFNWVMNYSIILNRMLNVSGQNVDQVVESMWNAYWLAKTKRPYSMKHIPEEQALYFFYRLIYKKHYRFKKFHTHVQAHMSLNEYRLRTGWLIGRYDFDWLPSTRDENIVYTWAAKQKEVPKRLAMPLAIRSLHNEAKGSAPNGM